MQPPEPQTNGEAEPTVRVLLLSDVRTCTLKSNSAFEVTAGATEAGHRRFEQSDKAHRVTISGGVLTIESRSFEGGEIGIGPEEPEVLEVNGREYRGRLRLIVHPNGESFDVVNDVALEPYLAGVVGAEMPDYWEPEALKAQAIAARTYCLYMKDRFGGGRAWDVSRTQAHQVYRGVVAESPQIWHAVNQTRGQVLNCEKADGSQGIFPAYYSSTCGGHTEDSENVFGDSFEPLRGTDCPYCQDVARPKFFFWPTVVLGKAEVADKLRQRYPKLKELGTITDISVVGQSDYGKFRRLTKVRLSGSNGKSEFLRAEDLRLTLDPTGRRLKSTICEITASRKKWMFRLGRGYGHGVGMCQCGAQAMARQAHKAEQILSYYYPSSRIVRLY